MPDALFAGAGARASLDPGCPSCAAHDGAPLRVGVDVASIAEVRAALDRFGDRYTSRVFTRHEVATAGAGAGRAYPLAACVAAKGAVTRMLGQDASPAIWREIEVCRGAAGARGLALRGRAAALARTGALGPLSPRLTDAAGLAVAVVTAAPAVFRCPHGLLGLREPRYAHGLHLHGHDARVGGGGHAWRADLADRPAVRVDRCPPATRTATATREVVRAVLSARTALGAVVGALGDDDDLLEAGLTSHETVTVLLELEDALSAELPDTMLGNGTFGSVGALAGEVDRLLWGAGR